MKVIHKSLSILISGIVIAGVLTMFWSIQRQKAKTIIYEIENAEVFCMEQDIPFSITDTIQYYSVSDTSILIWDQRNSDKSRYVYSKVEVYFDNHGILTVTITDSIAISESDITGNYAVLVKCSNKVNDVIIKQEDKNQ